MFRQDRESLLLNSAKLAGTAPRTLGRKQSNKLPFTPTRKCMQASDNGPTVGRKSSGVKLVPRQKKSLDEVCCGCKLPSNLQLGRDAPAELKI
jgi:hypothetical protein